MSWIILTMLGATIQSFRNLEQRSLNKKLDALTVSWSRFILPLPLAIATMIYILPQTSGKFVCYCLVTAICQIAGNFFLLKIMSSKNFSVGIAFFKTEVLQSLLLGVLLFNQDVSLMGIAAILVTSIGMILMSNISLTKKTGLDKAALFGALSGLAFSISAFGIKFGTQEMKLLGYGNVAAGITDLCFVVFFQNLFFITVKSLQNRLRKDLRSMIAAENKLSFLKTSILSLIGSILWFVAFAIGNVIYVKAVGQIELVIAVLISLHLGEKHNKREFAGIAVTAFGILTLIFSQI